MDTPTIAEIEGATKRAADRKLLNDAAPDMLAALETAWEFIGHHSQGNPYLTEPGKTVAAAIAKARGQGPSSSDPYHQEKAAGWRVHHDIYGWYVVRPSEKEPEDGYNLGFDGRYHHALEEHAWLKVADLHREALALGEDDDQGPAEPE